MINDFICLDTIAVHVKADTWEEAIRKSGELLLTIDAIEEKYIDAMINNVKKLGSYIVIAPQIAMPHARPEDGVKKTAISIMTLDKGVEFGHEKNDPVKLVIALAALDSKAHIQTLAQIMELLGDLNILNNILNSKSPQEILNSIAL